MGNKHRGKKGDNPQYTTLYYGFLKSEAWRSLSGAAVKVWLELHTRYNGGNNGNLRLSLNEAAKTLCLSKGTAQRAFLELEEKGFIALQTPGNWYNRRAHEYRLTTKPMQTNKGKQAATDDWKNWCKKTKCGPPEYPSHSPLGPPQNRKASNGSTTEPVKPFSGQSLGTQVGH